MYIASAMSKKLRQAGYAWGGEREFWGNYLYNRITFSPTVPYGSNSPHGVETCCACWFTVRATMRRCDDATLSQGGRKACPLPETYVRKATIERISVQTPPVCAKRINNIGELLTTDGIMQGMSTESPAQGQGFHVGFYSTLQRYRGRAVSVVVHVSSITLSAE